MTAFVPVSFGFALMSFVDYRADSFGVFYFGASLVLLEWNRKAGSTALAVTAGVLAALASGMTQKMVAISGATVLAMFLFDKLAALPALRSRLGPRAAGPFLAHPGWFFGSVFLSGGLLLAGAAALGIVPRGFELTVLQALEHERIYEPFSVFERGYVTPFWDLTWISTVPLIAFAAVHLVTQPGRFWVFPISVAAFACAMMVAPYPYNFVFICWVAVLVAVRGFCQVLTWLGEIAPRLRVAAPVLCIASLVVVANQHSFVAGTTTNAHQLRVLERIETYGSPADSVIDGSGGAMFSWDASYYFYHGQAHRKMFLEYFTTQLPEDYRRSRSLFWIKDMRAAGLPKAALEYLYGNYIDGGGDLWVIGYATPETDSESVTISIDFVREGEYYFHHTRKARGRSGRRPNIQVDGVPLRRNRFYFEEKRYEITVGPHAGQFVITPVKTGFFDQSAPTRPHYTMLFQYGEWERNSGSDEAAAPQNN